MSHAWVERTMCETMAMVGVWTDASGPRSFGRIHGIRLVRRPFPLSSLRMGENSVRARQLITTI